MSKKPVKRTIKSIDKKNLDIYDRFRPHSGIKYYLSQTELDLNAGVPRIHVKQTTVEYEPGQDLTTPPAETEESVIKYTKRQCRGPVWRFQEEIDAEKREIRANMMKKIAMKRIKSKVPDDSNVQMNKQHDKIIKSIGPKWYHELSNKQMQSADRLRAALLKDHRSNTVENVQDMLADLGLAVWPHRTKIACALKKYYTCPVEFLLKLCQLNRCKKEIEENTYTLDNKLLLSAVVHLTMRNTLRELHLRLPSPPRVKKEKHTVQETKKIKTHPSPYLNPFPFIPQKRTDEIYKNRKKEYPKSRYFNYIDDMYEVYYDIQSESTIRKQKKMKVTSKYAKPPQIPVRQLARKMIPKQQYRLKKPSVYVNPCDDKVKTPEAVPNERSHLSNKSTILYTSTLKMHKSTRTMLNVVDKPLTKEPSIKLHPESEKSEQTFDNGAIKEQSVDNIEELSDECTCEPVAEAKDERERQKDPFYLCTCGQPDIDNIFKYYRQRHQQHKQFIYNLNMFNIENKTFYHPCICQRGDIKSPDFNLEHENHGTNVINEEKRPNEDIEEKETQSLTDENKVKEMYQREQEGEARQSKVEDLKKNVNVNKDELKKSVNINKDDLKKSVNVNKDDLKKSVDANNKGLTSKGTATTKENVTSKNKPREKSTDGKSIDKSQSIEQNSDEPNEESTKKSTEKEKCVCTQLHKAFMDNHEYCLDLFEDYKLKIKQDIEDYMNDITRDRCACGDSTETINEENKSNDSLDGTEECTCSPTNRKPSRDQRRLSTMNDFAGCTCGNNAYNECNCGNNSCNCGTDNCNCWTCGCNKEGFMQTDELKMCTCKLKHTNTNTHHAIKEKSTLSAIMEETEETIHNVEQETQNFAPEPKASARSSVKVEHVHEESCKDIKRVSCIEVVKETDPRVLVLKKFPRRRKQQMILLQKALAAMAKDGYPLAKLPNCHELPHFQVWLNKRSGKFISMATRAKYLEKSRVLWNHIEICKRKVDLPELGIHPSVARKMTWAGAYKYQRMIADTMYCFNRKLKQAYVSEAQEFFPTTFHYQMSNKTFRDCFFAYLPSDEHHINVARPWKSHEYKERISVLFTLHKYFDTQANCKHQDMYCTAAFFL